MTNNNNSRPSPTWFQPVIGAIATVAIAVGGSMIATAKQSGEQTQRQVDTERRVQGLETAVSTASNSQRRMEIIIYRLADKLQIRTDDVR